MAERSSSKKRQGSKTGEPGPSPGSAEPTRRDYLRYVLAEAGAEDMKPPPDARFGRGGLFRRQRTPSPATVYRRMQQWKEDHPDSPDFARLPPREIDSDSESESDLDITSESESQGPPPQALQTKASRARSTREPPPKPPAKSSRPAADEYAYNRPRSAGSRIVNRLSISQEGTEAAVEEITVKTSSFLQKLLTSPFFRVPAAALLILLFLQDILPAEYVGYHCKDCHKRWWLLIPVLWLLRLDKVASYFLGIAEAALVGFCRGIGAFGRDMCFLFLVLSVVVFHFLVLLFFGPLGFLVVLSITWTVWYFCVQGLLRSWRDSYRDERRRRDRSRRRYSGY